MGSIIDSTVGVIGLILTLLALVGGSIWALVIWIVSRLDKMHTRISDGKRECNESVARIAKQFQEFEHAADQRHETTRCYFDETLHAMREKINQDKLEAFRTFLHRQDFTELEGRRREDMARSEETRRQEFKEFADRIEKQLARFDAKLDAIAKD